MSLSYDVARCAGTTAPLCLWCRRKEPGRPEWQAHIQPAWTIQGCDNYIAPVSVIIEKKDTQ